MNAITLSARDMPERLGSQVHKGGSMSRNRASSAASGEIFFAPVPRMPMIVHLSRTIVVPKYRTKSIFGFAADHPRSVPTDFLLTHSIHATGRAEDLFSDRRPIAFH
ncbi:hypothetical protein JDN40_15090 [Rhodomicrobium vannielii ATCC 17100]|uniref:hypothetical protein n=1 Tax=Rhodomicrobium vannielii TaxID=1069 RepID=UPI001917F3C9|nr:hypothetical protein [Rhodomicrobium vannielii]MBJ7535433.1 hypothetical protein [Rhodomicrobium vannielii ATCC 17100]